MSARYHRVYLQGSPLTFIVTLTLLLLASMLLWAFLNISDNSRFGLIPPTVVLFGLAYFVHKASLSWIQISASGEELVKIPSWFARKLSGEKRVITKAPQGSEIVLCRRLAYGGLQGYCLLVRAPDGTEQEIWNDVTGVTRGRWTRAATEIGERCQLRVRIVTQTISDKGTEETDWTALTDKKKWKMLRIMVGPAVAPWLGIGVRILTSNPILILAFGLVLWLIGASVFWYIYRTREVSKEQSLHLTILVWTLQFITFYVVSVLATGTFIKRS
jgi:hypothetical protein